VYPCPVCGHQTFTGPPGSYDICEVCGWEDDSLQLEFATTLSGGANGITLADAQAGFASTRARLARRLPGAAYPRDMDPSWRPIDPTRDHFPVWSNAAEERAPRSDESLYYWKDTFWRRHAAS
jgi:hypothetical protein